MLDSVKCIIKIYFLFTFNEAVRTFKIFIMVHIVFIFDSISLEDNLDKQTLCFDTRAMKGYRTREAK